MSFCIPLSFLSLSFYLWTNYANEEVIASNGLLTQPLAGVVRWNFVFSPLFRGMGMLHDRERVVVKEESYVV